MDYRTGSALDGLRPLRLNCQIEHHLSPDVPLFVCRRVQTQVQQIFARFGVPFPQVPVRTRFTRMSRVFGSIAPMPWMERGSWQSLTEAAT